MRLLSSSRPSREPTALFLPIAALRVLVGAPTAGHVTAAAIPSAVAPPSVAPVLVSARGKPTAHCTLVVHAGVLLVAPARDLLLAWGGQQVRGEGDGDKGERGMVDSGLV